ncbi:MAG: hypothetical protein WDZ72_04255 [Cyclobacteriaceae bacterium]
MNRRTFISRNGQLVFLSPIIPLATLNPLFKREEAAVGGNTKPTWLVKMIENNDGSVDRILEWYISEKSDPKLGAILDAYGIPSPHASTSFLKSGICALITEESKYHKDGSLLEKLGHSAKFLLNLQHEDGTIDLLSTNFHSTPDTGFIVKWLAPIYRMLLASTVSQKEKISQPLFTFLMKAGNALTTGGIHTPNHRWVVCSALAELYKIEPHQKYLERANTWLAEGIDLDPDGQYEEKSSYIYSSLSDRVLISTARGFDKPELLENVRKNLEMTFYYLHPNGEIVTEASGRQDNSIIGTLENYYYPYRYLAIKDNNGQFAAACKLIEKTSFEKTTGFLYYFLEDQSLWEELPPEENLPTNYAKVYKHSGLARIRRGDYDASILANNPVFFTFHKKNVMLQGIRLASAFFGKGQFTSPEIQEHEGKYILRSHLEGPYYQPFAKDKISGDGDWSKMPRSQRPQSEIQILNTTISIEEVEGGFELEINIQGTSHVPLALEIIFRPGGKLEGTLPNEMKDGGSFLKTGMATYEKDGEIIHFGPGFHQHRWVAIRGALPLMDAPTVFLTGFTPFYHKLKIS